MHAVLALLCSAIFTPLLGGLVIAASLLGVEDREGGVYDWAARTWARILVRVAGVRIVVHGAGQLERRQAHVFAANHVSWYDVFVLASLLPRNKFVAKAELFRIPIFGPAARAAGTVPIERENRKAAFGAYDQAAHQIRAGSSVIVFPEGTRGADYRLRAFKKGPFVLAIAAQVPVVPMVVHGTIAVLPRGSWRARPARVDVHLLEPVETTGMTYEDRDRLARLVWARMADALQQHYGVQSAPERLPSAAAV